MQSAKKVNIYIYIYIYNYKETSNRNVNKETNDWNKNIYIKITNI